MPEFRDNKDEGEILVEILSEFLELPVNKQFQSIFVEAFARQSTKSQASNNKNLEAEAEELFQMFQLLQKQMDNIRKVITDKSDADVEAVLAPVQAYFAK